MSLTDINGLVLRCFATGAAVTLLLIPFFLIGYFFVYRRLFGGKKRIGRKQAAAWMILCIYFIMVLGVTFFNRDGESGGGTNLHLFSSYRNAWNSFTLKNWQYVTLNIVMFVPLGMLLPVCHKNFRKGYMTVLAGALFTVGIECTQLMTGYGVFEYDDILNNLIGTVAGYGLVMAFMPPAGKRRRILRSALYLMLPLSVLALFAGIFIKYRRQPFGNLPGDYIYRMEVDGARIFLNTDLNEQEAEVFVYGPKERSEQEGTEEALRLFALLGAPKENPASVKRQDGNVIVRSASTDESLEFCLSDGTFIYRNSSKTQAGTGNGDGEYLQDLLRKLGIFGSRIPDPEQRADGGYSYKAEDEPGGDEFRKGDLEVWLNADGTIRTLANGITVYRPAAEVPIISEKEAFARMAGGYFRIYQEGDHISSLEVNRVRLDYRRDTKGYYQPVYLFSTRANEVGTTIMIPALRR